MSRAITRYPAYESRPDALQPEVVDPRIADVEALARWLDYAFTLPGGFQYGVGGIIGLIPGLGDLFDAVLSLYIVARAVQLGIPRVTLARMVLNVGIETAAGMVPLLGALFDTVFKANRRNDQLLKKQLSNKRHQTAKDWLFLISAMAVVVALVAIPVVIVIEIAKRI